MESIKMGLDIHGVIDKDPAFFSNLTRKMRAAGHEIHILTGSELNDNMVNRLSDLGISYDQLFSITTYHKKIGTHISYKGGDPTQPLIVPEKWDRTKAMYARKENLHLHIDDSEVYGYYFRDISTQYIIYTPPVRSFLMFLLGETP